MLAQNYCTMVLSIITLSKRILCKNTIKMSKMWLSVCAIFKTTKQPKKHFAFGTSKAAPVVRSLRKIGIKVINQKMLKTDSVKKLQNNINDLQPTYNRSSECTFSIKMASKKMTFADKLLKIISSVISFVHLAQSLCLSHDTWAQFVI